MFPKEHSKKRLGSNKGSMKINNSRNRMKKWIIAIKNFRKKKGIKNNSNIKSKNGIIYIVIYCISMLLETKKVILKINDIEGKKA